MHRRKPKIVFIQPRFENKKLDRNYRTVYPLGLGYLAAYVPDHWDVEIIDEQVDKIDFDIDVDLVGITTTTLTANRAYEIAKEFRKRNVKVILGGVHASMCPEEAQQYCDSICIGDGEHVIGQIIKDFENNRLKKIYVGKLEPLKNLKFPRRDLFKKKYSFIPVSTSRGCPFNCSFCAIHKFYRGTYRKRDVEDVIEELKQLPKGYDIVFFTDGNAYGYSKEDIDRFKELCKRIYEERCKGNLNFKYFMCYVSVNALDDIEALELASKAGCAVLLVGFESINPNSLKEMSKGINLKYGVESYNRLIRNAQKRNMMVLGELIVGNDSDDKETLDKTREFIKNADLDILRLHILQPFPGTRIFEKLRRERRLYLKNFPEDWKKLRDGFLVGVHFKPKHFNEKELQKWVKKVALEFYSLKNILARAWKTFRYSKSLKAALTVIIMNIKSSKTYINLNV
jgi:radical SAM superfamily enzyme YgiQ (UPF0313 family)